MSGFIALRQGGDRQNADFATITFVQAKGKSMQEGRSENAIVSPVNIHKPFVRLREPCCLRLAGWNEGGGSGTGEGDLAP